MKQSITVSPTIPNFSNRSFIDSAWVLRSVQFRLRDRALGTHTHEVTGVLSWMDGWIKVSNTTLRQTREVCLIILILYFKALKLWFLQGHRALLSGIKTIASDSSAKSVCQLHHLTKVIHCTTFKYFKLNCGIILQNLNVDEIDDILEAHLSFTKVMQLTFFQQNQSCVNMQVSPSVLCCESSHYMWK